jgi:outer membrane protein TolC
MKTLNFFFKVLLALCPTITYSQTLPLKEAIEVGIANYGIVKAKNNYAQASKEAIEQAKREYLPNLNLSAQQDYGTVNGQNGPLYGLGGLGVASSGLPLKEQNWNASFGALYLVNVNWEFFTFGRIKQRVSVAKAESERYQKDYEQELFQHKVRIASAYLNLLVSQRLQISQEKNLHRAEVFYHNIATRAKNGLLPGVDSTSALAEVSKARITLIQVNEQIKVQNNELVTLLGQQPQDYVTDTTIISKAPLAVTAAQATTGGINHPTKQYFQSRISQSIQQEKLFQKEYYPSFTLFGVYQTRASGFNSVYTTDQTSFSSKYFDGVNPSRQNYLLGAGLVWNLTSIARSSKKLSFQRFTTKGLEDEFKAIDVELNAREDAANARIEYALQNFKEAPIQVTAAQQAYIQRLALYQSGLTILTDLTSALFTLNRAETDRDIAFANVWQALLMKAAATGNFDLFINEF